MKVLIRQNVQVGLYYCCSHIHSSGDFLPKQSTILFSLSKYVVSTHYKCWRGTSDEFPTTCFPEKKNNKKKDKRAIIQFMDNAGPDQPAQADHVHSRRLIRAFVAHLQNQWIYRICG